MSSLILFQGLEYLECQNTSAPIVCLFYYVPFIQFPTMYDLYFVLLLYLRDKIYITNFFWRDSLTVYSSLDLFLSLLSPY